MFIFRLRRQIIFYRELQMMIDSGLPIVDAIGLLHKQFSEEKFRAVISHLQQDIAAGRTLSSALANFPRFFPLWQTRIITYSEASGKLAQGLRSIANYLEKEYDFHRRLIISLIYPILLLHLAIFLLPLAELIKGNPRRYFLAVAKPTLWIYSLAAVFYLFRRLRCRFETAYGYFVLKIPFFGGLAQRIALNRFLRSLKSLYEAGVDIIEGWRIAADVCAYGYLKEKLLKGLSCIERGEELGQAFAQSGVFGAKAIGMIRVGEKSGGIAPMLERMVAYYEKDTDLALDILARIIPLFVYVLVAGYIGYRVISFYLCHFSKMFAFP